MADNCESQKQSIKLNLSEGKNLIFLFLKALYTWLFQGRLYQKGKAFLSQYSTLILSALIIGKQEQRTAAKR